MLIRSTHNPDDEAGLMEVRLAGPGRASIALVDPTGSILSTLRLTLAGHDGIGGKASIPTHIKVADAKVRVIPAVVFQSNPDQEIRFQDEPHRQVTTGLVREIGIDLIAFLNFIDSRRAFEQSLWLRRRPLKAES